MTSQARDQRASRSPYAHSQPSRGSDSRSAPRIIVEPTPENQQIYNEIRQTHERLRLQTHLASQQNLQPSSAAPSISTAHSPIDEPVTSSTQDPTSQDIDNARRPRGRRKGPLQAETRLKTAVKRKLKLACPHHRVKKITCDCHDFSKLEEGFHSFQQQQQQQQSTSRRRSHDSNAISPLTPSGRTFNNGEMLGIGGAAMDPEPFSIELDILQPTADDQENVVRSDVQRIVSEFDSDTVRLTSTMLQAPGQTYHPGNDNDMGTPSPRDYTEDDYLEIGSQNQNYPNRWHCRYKGDVDSLLESTSQMCTWSGSMRGLQSHFWRVHHPFQAATPCFWHVCTRCGAKVQPQNDLGPPLSPLQCVTPDCLASSFERWYFGSTRSESVADSVPGLTQSTESEAGFSCFLSPDGDQPRLAPNGTQAATCLINYLDAAAIPRIVIAPQPRRTELSGIYHIRERNHVSMSGRENVHLDVVLYAYYLTTVIREGGYLFESHPSSARTFDSGAICWWSLVLLCLGFAATWTFKDQRARARSTDKSDSRTGGHRILRNGPPLMTFCYSVV
ncbi:hypothetical protein Hte_012227 [Hypoxylon texense]